MDSVFREQLRNVMTSEGGSLRWAGKGGSRARRWIYVHEDQLSDQIGPLAVISDPSQVGVLLVEHHWKASLRPYHKHRLALIWANQRHFALELAQRGLHIEYRIATQPLAAELASAASDLRIDSMTMMRAAERETRHDLRRLTDGDGLVQCANHDGWLTTRAQFDEAHAGLKGSPRWKMDSFYRHVRKATGILMNPDGTYVGGKVSFDTENRESWSGRLDEPPAPAPLTFAPDPITLEVIAMVETDFARHPGSIIVDRLPASRADADRLWAWAKTSCLRHFGPYEDAMSVRSRSVFHTGVSSLLNLHRLLPRTLVADVEAMNIPLQSKEGFIRQILGWREFVKHVHDATDGFRDGHPTTRAPGDGGYAGWSGTAWTALSSVENGGYGGADPTRAGTPARLPPCYWQMPSTSSAGHDHANGPRSGLACLDHVVQGVWADAWSHHITRLMILSNIATLLDISPRELTDWFWVAFSDAWDWVVEPNVLAMGTYSVGDLMTTKPYISGSAYINKMSDYCQSCKFDPESTCPITRLYWAFLARHEKLLAGNARMMMPMRSLAKRSDAARRADSRVFVAVSEVLVRGQRVTPELVSRALSDPDAPTSATASKKGSKRA